jgi:hypothetical protein
MPLQEFAPATTTIPTTVPTAISLQKRRGEPIRLHLQPWESQLGISIEISFGIRVVAGANSCNGHPFMYYEHHILLTF